MKLSIHIVYDRIRSEKSCLTSNDSVFLDLTGVRIYSPNTTNLSNELLYIVKADELSSLPSENHLSLVCLGDLNKSSVSNKWSIIVLPTIHDVFSLFEMIQSVFEEYDQWISNINNSIFNGDSLQSVLDKSSIYLHNPVALFDNSRGLLMRSGDLTTSRLDSIWTYVLEKGYSFKETEDTFLEQKITSSHRPFYYNSPDVHNTVNRLIAPIFVKDSYFGTLAMTDLSALFSKAEYANLCIVQDVIQNALNVTDEYVLNPETPMYLHKLITGQYVDYNVVSHYLSLRGSKSDDKSFLWCFSASKNSTSKDFNAQGYLYHLSDLFESAIVFSHESMLLVCDYNLENYHDTKFEKTIDDFLSRTKLKVSISNVFCNIFEMNYAFNQCKISNEFFNENSKQIIRFKEIYFDYVLSSIEKNVNPNVLVTSEIRSLNSADAYTAELLLTLLSYIASGRNITAAAKELNIHRHTVVYRLNNIHRITGIVLDNLDDSSIFQLYLSCRILLRNTL